MASLIPGYNYDIFISYRQKDNKHDGWVTEFVNNLKGELESTFKEEISVYFDINPHDGLLETHDVEASLKEKLKCLIFIPIISRTYCDPKSFAWEHEFKEFVRKTSNDQFGLKIKLPNGNVANRMIPIQIHDLYPEDKALIESELGGALRTIEFVYKEPGVNRPLLSKDNEEKNLNGTNYRNQVNKVANAIDEIIHSLKEHQIITLTGKSYPDQPVQDVKAVSGKQLSVGIVQRKRSGIKLVFLLSLLVVISTVFVLVSRLMSGKPDNAISELDKSIAVLPFKNMSNDPVQDNFSNEIMLEIMNHLFKIGGLKITSSSSTLRFRESQLSVQEIAGRLGVSYVLEGNVSRSDSVVRIIVTLITGKNEEVIWSNDYKRSLTARDIFDIQSDIALQVASNLKLVIDPAVSKRIRAHPTENTEAYLLYLQSMGLDLDYPKVMKLLERAVSLDPDFADAWASMALWRMWYMGDSLTREQLLEKVEPLLNKALQLDNNSVVAHNVKADLMMWYYWDLDAVEKEFQIVKELNPSGNNSFWGFVQYLWAVGRSDEAYAICKENFEQPEISEQSWIYMALAYSYIGENDKAVKTIESALHYFPHGDFLIHNALEIYVNSSGYDLIMKLYRKDLSDKKLKDLPDYLIGPLGVAFFKTGEADKVEVALEILSARNNKNFARGQANFSTAMIYVSMGRYEEALQYLEKSYTKRELALVNLNAEPIFRPLYKYPQFDTLLKKIGVK